MTLAALLAITACAPPAGPPSALDSGPDARPIAEGGLAGSLFLYGPHAADQSAAFCARHDRVLGDLWIEGVTSGDLGGLGCLREVGGHVFIQHNPTLVDLAGLGACAPSAAPWRSTATPRSPASPGWIGWSGSAACARATTERSRTCGGWRGWCESKALWSSTGATPWSASRGWGGWPGWGAT